MEMDRHPPDLREPALRVSSDPPSGRGEIARPPLRPAVELAATPRIPDSDRGVLPMPEELPHPSAGGRLPAALTARSPRRSPSNGISARRTSANPPSGHG